jgi:ribosomal protein S18 acetylase RimI-like enzyme
MFAGDPEEHSWLRRGEQSFSVDRDRLAIFGLTKTLGWNAAAERVLGGQRPPEKGPREPLPLPASVRGRREMASKLRILPAGVSEPAPATEQDAAGIAALEAASMPLSARSKERITAKLADISVIRKGGEPVAYMQSRFDDWPAPRVEVAFLGVHPDFRREGLADHLMAEAEAKARAQRAVAIHLDVRAGNQRARSLYIALGFSNFGGKKYADGEPGIRMVKMLHEPSHA